MRVPRWSAALLVAISMSCAAVLGIEDPVVEHSIATDGGGDGDPRGETGPALDGARESSADGGLDADANTKDDAGCPLGRGPSMIAHLSISPGDPARKAFCIDRTEVTSAQWSAFKDEAVAPASQTADCAWNTSFAVGSATRDAYPVVRVNWCDAKAFCRWAGKRLCGAIAGGPTPPGGAGDPNVAQWAYACSNRGTTTYPYGNGFQAGACNIAGDAGSVVPAGSLSTCSTTRGVLDQVGNVWEWIDHRIAQDAGPTGDTASFLGGESGSPSIYDCAAGSGAGISLRDPLVGFRCCADPF